MGTECSSECQDNMSVCKNGAEPQSKNTASIESSKGVICSENPTLSNSEHPLKEQMDLQAKRDQPQTEHDRLIEALRGNDAKRKVECLGNSIYRIEWQDGSRYEGGIKEGTYEGKVSRVDGRAPTNHRRGTGTRVSSLAAGAMARASSGSGRPTRSTRAHSARTSWRASAGRRGSAESQGQAG